MSSSRGESRSKQHHYDSLDSGLANWSKVFVQMVVVVAGVVFRQGNYSAQIQT